jgi:hypothetical protein
VLLPSAPRVHLFLASGSVDVEGIADPALGPGDAVRLTESDGERLTAHEVSEVLVWELRQDEIR